MQSGSWYLHRLKAMSAAEVCWRLTAAARGSVDSLRFAVGAEPAVRVDAASATRLTSAAPPRLCDVQKGEWAAATNGSREASWRDRLVRAADAIARHRLRIFGREVFLGSPIEWNRDHVHGTSTPLDFANRIDYRDRRVAGDAKIVWEPNRHQHLVVLARAYRVTGDSRYASAALDQMVSWLDQSPFAAGMNWRSPLELAIRLINWTWTLDLIRDAQVVTPAVAARLLRAIYLHLHDVSRKFSRGSSANNHLIGEAAGVFVASTYFPELDHDGRWANQSRDILCREIEAQTHDDGGTREQALGYQFFVLDLLFAVGLTARALGVALPGGFWTRLEKMLEFVAALAEGGPVPMFGDCDDGYALDLGRNANLATAPLAIGAALFNRRDFARVAGDVAEPVRWFLGVQGQERCAALVADAPDSMRLVSRALAPTGYYLLQCGSTAHDPISAVFDCGPLGFTALAAHGHADALSLSVRAFGIDVLVDPGTFDYFSYPEWRTHFKSTYAHNTVTIDGMDQSLQLGSFLWGAHARARCVSWDPSPQGGGSVTGEHDGYARLADPVRHQRTVRLDASSRTLVVRDELSMGGEHDVVVTFQFAEHWVATRQGEHAWYLTCGSHGVRLDVDHRLASRLHVGSDDPRAGWVSRGYHHRAPAPAIACHARVDGDVSFEWRLSFERAATDAPAAAPEGLNG